MTGVVTEESRAILARAGLEFVRWMPDGAAEFRLLGYVTDRRWRGPIAYCRSCRSPFPALVAERENFFGEKFFTCSPCKQRAAEERIRNEKEENERYRNSAEYKMWRKSVAVENYQRRSVALSCSKVRWADRAKIRKIYAEARSVSKRTGVPHDVDHIYPLQSLFVCGLHVEHNLCVSPASQNRSKNNGFDLKHSPALRACFEDGSFNDFVCEVRNFVSSERKRKKVKEAA